MLEKHGLLSFNSHPDYIKVPLYNKVYESLPGYLQRVCDEQNIWNALPGEVNKWWMARREMQLALNCAKCDRSGWGRGPSGQSWLTRGSMMIALLTKLREENEFFRVMSDWIEVLL
jgi:hypothetical protein